MRNENRKVLLVGDNPFQGISHLSQDRERLRGDKITQTDYAADLVLISVDHGAAGFMFTVSEKTLSILEVIRKKERIRQIALRALVPYAYEYVRLANQLGGIPGLAKRVAKQIVMSGNVKAIVAGSKAVIRMDPIELMKAYLTYEISRIRSFAGRHANLESLFLHEVISDMALALKLDWLFKSYIEFVSKLGIRPGFVTRNFPILVDDFRNWDIDFDEVLITTPFNKLGFQMNPSRSMCERALASLPKPNVIAMSIFAAGHIAPMEATEYIKNLPNIEGIVVGVSQELHACETFDLLRQCLE
jgi:hypothetical protein